jgi:predicted RecB family nuclease
VATKITRQILEAYLNCKTKAHLKLEGQRGITSDYEALLISTRQEVRQQAIGKILARNPEGAVARDIPLATATLRAGSSFVLNATLEDDLLSLSFDGLKRVDGSSKLGDFHYVPMLFHEGLRVGKEQRLLLELYGVLLSQIQGRLPANAVVWHGRKCKITTVRFTPDVRRTERLLREVKETTGTSSPPRLILNNHCSICEFRQRCHDQAVKEDNLSLFRGLGEKEMRKLGRKGIFTITQLSCTFRLRKRGKRVKRQQRPRYFALQAAAIRDKKIYVLKPPPLPTSPVRIYLDIEGDSERSFAYLLGMIVDNGGNCTQFSFWADNEDQEHLVFRRLLELVSRHEDYALIHYGSYETSFLKRMKKAFGRTPVVTKLLSRTVNLLSVIHTHIYFPLYSNGLKEIGRYLGCKWTDPDASGLKSISLRSRWQEEHDATLKRELERYNLEDCEALKRVAEFVYTISEGFDKDSSIPEIVMEGRIVADAENVNPVVASREIPRTSFAHPDLQFVTQCAYFDYQREKVFLRTNDAVRRANSMKKRQEKPRKLKIDKVIEVQSRKCPTCAFSSPVRHFDKSRSKLAYNLRVSESGIKRQVILCKAALHYCTGCHGYFLPPRYKRAAKHFHSLMSWTMYQHVVHRVSFEMLEPMLKDYFNLTVSYVEIHMFKVLVARYYRTTYQQILSKLLSGDILHLDETNVNFRHGKGYVWVVANMENVVYVYRPTRDGDWLHELLCNFKGVLITDFFSAYDSIKCEQQKCLVHLIRDLNDDLLRNPYDGDFRWLVSEFGALLRSIINTIDQHGLRQRNLHKHELGVDHFFKVLEGRAFSSEVADDYRGRLVRYRDKLFTFLRHDGVPWNNNNAEHAIKPFARYRAIADGVMGEHRLRDYLVLLSLYQTCKYRGISFLRFLLSGATDLDKFRDTGRVSNSKTSLELYPKGLSNFPQQGRSKKAKAMMDKPFYPHG